MSRILSYDTARKSEIRSITDDLRDCIREGRVENGTLLVYSMHTTLGVTIQETSEPNLCNDFVDFLTHSSRTTATSTRTGARSSRAAPATRTASTARATSARCSSTRR